MGTVEEGRQRLLELVRPERTALLTMEMQRGAIGDAASLPALTAEVEGSGLVPNVSRLAAGARQVGVRVVHCTAVARPDGAGSSENCRIFAIVAKQARRQGRWSNQLGTPGAEVVPELAGDSRDIEVPRLHGMTPFTSTGLDQILRNLGVTTVIVTGVSVNLGVAGTALTALDLGYQVVIPRDGVVGVPGAYAQQVLDNSLSLIATIVTIDDILDAWA